MQDYAAAIRRYWLVIAVLFIVTTASTLVVSLMLPRIYVSTTSLLVPRETGASFFSGMAAASALLQQAPGLTAPSLTPTRDMLLGILKSRTVAVATVQRFGLQERYRAPYLSAAIEQLHRHVDVTLTREGVIVITAEDIHPQTAADIANFFVSELDRLVAKYGTSEAGRQREFIAEQLVRARAQLSATEDGLRRFQERNRAVVLQEQTRGAIEAAARLKGEIIASEVQLQVMRQFATEANPEVLALRRRAEEMKRQLAQMEYGDGVPRPQAAPMGERRDFTVPFAKMPEVGLELARLMRDVKIQETLVTLLTQQLEQARISEAKDLPIVQVLDHAVPSERHVKPRVRVNLVVSAIASLLAGIGVALLLQRVRRPPAIGERT
jgi:uncharacterized protein involved in exopolysaccharide biosynthesis